ncbi:hypothetical protein HDA32_003972 [Spinactinospora alkalitolerans]|uniref:Uncharacterized protein n=1 Tax=Spinactinospora alkalitolerans TaxID=687207 RepID=A0A852U0J4_9ACTN|nr:hypothetical protein [Spinactinospora alkalitolerans]NYE48852.1 hypothetical protein [Spinactinospora alkalitolerans]
MRLTRIGGTCEDDNCPTLYATDRGTVVVQGYAVTDADALNALGLPEGESAVEVPAELLKGVSAGS